MRRADSASAQLIRDGSTDCPQTRLASTDDKTSSSHTLTGRIWEDSMNQGTHPEELPAEVLDDVGSRMRPIQALSSAGGEADSVRELSVTATGRCSANDRSAAAATRAVIRPSSR
jgi:hypothetical protein